MAANNPIIEVYNGVTIRENNTFQIRLNAPLYKFLILESERTGMPISRILVYSSTPCERCPMTDIIAYNSDNEAVNIKRGILSRNVCKKTSGSSIIQQAHAKNK